MVLPWQSYGMSPAIWNHIVLPATRHRWTRFALTQPVTQFATSSRRLPTHSADNLETGQTDSIAVWLLKFWSTLITFQRWRHYVVTCHQPQKLNSTGNCKLGHDCLRVRSQHRHDATGLLCWQICPDSSKLSPTSCKLCTHRRRNSTRHSSRRVESRRRRRRGVYWAEDNFIGRLDRRGNRRPLVFPHDLWNVHNRVSEEALPRTNNSVEAWYHSELVSSSNPSSAGEHGILICGCLLMHWRGCRS